MPCGLAPLTPGRDPVTLQWSRAELTRWLLSQRDLLGFCDRGHQHCPGSSQPFEGRECTEGGEGWGGFTHLSHPWGSMATYASVATIEGITGHGSLSCCQLGLQQAWKEIVW